MSTTVSNCGGDENGNLWGGRAGDQTGREYKVAPWSNWGQIAVYRHPDPTVRATIAELAREAAENDLIGYDQGQRLTFRDQLRRSGYRPRNISVACEADCSASTAAIIEATGKLLGNDALFQFDSTISTHNMDGELRAAGFDKLTGSKYLSTGSNLVAGDIQLKPGYHVNIVISGPGDASGGTQTGGFTVNQKVTFPEGVNIRADKSTRAEIVGEYDAGESCIIDSVYLADGIAWGSYVGASSGKRRYVALGHLDLARV